MNQAIKKIPFVGNLLVSMYRKIKGNPDFRSSSNYWETRYRKGGNSGAGSYNNLAEFKAEVINAFLEKNNVGSVIEFGCGDGNQLKYLHPKKYIGYDVSEKAVQICSELYKHDGTKTFKTTNEHITDRADLTMSLDVIYHLVEDSTFTQYMSQLFASSTKYVIIYSSNTNEKRFIAPHVKHRKFTDWVEMNQKQFKLIQHIPNKYPYNGDGERTSFADFYIYEKTA